MKIIKNDSNFTIFLNNFYTKELDFNKKETLENYFKNLFFKLKEKYNYEIAGFYSIYVYTDINYGIIIDVFKEDLDYLEYFKNSIDMQINKPEKIQFLYQIKDPLCISKKTIEKFNIYKYKNNYYLEIKQKLDEIKMGLVLENAKLIFDTKEIMKNGRLIEVR